MMIYIMIIDSINWHMTQIIWRKYTLQQNIKNAVNNKRLVSDTTLDI